ncbi:RNA-directed DNA polymerase from mobile element jockey [Eumeta japonica]|uniref:RNA-directed DNA polymerase from mobile element jockey n=1 Tax=Eumeta variegata TaxID=151549 RepID=A0A4C1YKD7_EUMVA|nr:RNA-directed DNA polymerase from mobile element jockey [Eumeta japonica]
MSQGNEYLLNNTLTEDFLLMLRPYYLIQKLLYVSKYKIKDNFVLPNSKAYCVFGVFILCFFTSVYFAVLGYVLSTFITSLVTLQMMIKLTENVKGGSITGLEPWWSLRYGRKSVFQAPVAPTHLTFAQPPAWVTHSPQQLVPLTWVQARMMEALRAVLTGQDPVTALLQSQYIHIVLLGKTKLRPKQQLRLPNFFVYRRDEVSPRGIAFRGTAALVRRDIVHGGLEQLDFTNTRSIGVRVGAAGADLRLFAAYRPPGSHFCSSDVHTIFDYSTPTILAGDLNAKHTAWGSRVISPAGRQLLKDSEQHGYEIIGPDTPSHIPTDPRFRADVMDVVLCHQLPYPIYVEVLYDMDTQHLPILITLGTTAHMTPALPQTHRTDWDAFRSALGELHIGKSFSCPEEVDTAAQRLTEEVQAAYSAATTRLPARTSRRWDLPPHLKLALQKKRNLHKLWARTRCPRIKRELNYITQDLRQAVWTFRGAAWEKTIEQAGEDWKSLHLLCRRLTRSPAPVCPLFDKTGTRRYAVKDRAEILAEHLEEQFTPHTPSDTPEAASHHAHVERQVDEFLMAPVPPLPGDYFVSPAETGKMISRLPKRKAPGPDGIPTAAIRQLPRRAMVAMTRLFNGIPDRTLSEELEDGPCHRHTESRQGPATRNEPTTNHAAVPHCLERIALRRLLRHLTPRQKQFGFRSGHSTTLQLVSPPPHGRRTQPGRRRRSLSRHREGVRPVWHPVEDATSDPRPIHAGVPQGSCLSPCLYGVYTDDIPTLAGQLQDWEEDVVLALYADDSAYFASSRRADLAAAKIQRVLDLLPEWLDKWRVAVNVTKTAAILTGQQRTMPPKLRPGTGC